MEAAMEEEWGKGRILQIMLFLRREEIWEIEGGANHTANAHIWKINP